MARAIWEGIVLAESDDIVEVDGYTYFPEDAVRWQHLKPSEKKSVCGWKGTARYWDISLNGNVNTDAAWNYAEPKPAAQIVKSRIGFWRGVQIER